MQWSVDPILVQLGPLTIHWYGVLFACGIWFGAEILKRQLMQEQRDVALIDQLFVPMIVGIIVGARLMHCLAYEPEYYLAHPLQILYVWQGGLASHGGGLGAILATLWVCKRQRVSLWYLLDRLAVPTLFFGACVRFGNLMNSEILGVPTELPWGMVFTRVDGLARHPAQLYEALAYSLLALGLWQARTRTFKVAGRQFGWFLLAVFSVRLLVEAVKVEQAAYVPMVPLTVGQLLSLPFMAVGLWLIFRPSASASQGAHGGIA